MEPKNEVTGWVGWVYFASLMMIIVGVFQAIVGFLTLFNDEYLLITPRNLIFMDATSWGWSHMLMGLLIVFAGYAVMSGKVWGRTLGVIMALVSAVANLSYMTANPFWAMTLVIVDFMVIYALTVHGHEMRISD
jgi:hypothetical protein